MQPLRMTSFILMVCAAMGCSDEEEGNVVDDRQVDADSGGSGDAGLDGSGGDADGGDADGGGDAGDGGSGGDTSSDVFPNEDVTGEDGAPDLPQEEVGPPAPGCEDPTGEGTEHQGLIDEDETWTVADSPHIVTGNISVRDATLTIEPCGVIRVQEGYTFTLDGVSDTGTLIAHGEAIDNEDGSTTIRPVIFVPYTEGTHWGSLLVRATGMLDLEYVELHGAGEHDTASSYGGTIVATGEAFEPMSRNVRVVSVSIADSEGLGVNLQGAGFTSDSEYLAISGSGRTPSPTTVVTDYPIFIQPPALQTIPSGAYTGNEIDAVYVFNAGNIREAETFREIGIPYHIGGAFFMQPVDTAEDDGVVVLTIEAGVTIEMEAGFGFTLGASNGRLEENIWPVTLAAEGTASAPIVFTSAEPTPAAGDWAGIEWYGGTATGSVVTHVRIEYAGADSGTGSFGCGPPDNDAGLIITNWRPTTDFIDNLTVSDSAAGGIVCGWMSDEDGPDFKVGNTFVNIGNDCDVARWANVTAPTCPGNDGLPDCL